MELNTPTQTEAAACTVVGTSVGTSTNNNNNNYNEKNNLVAMVAVDESQGSLYALSWALDNLLPTTPNKSYSWLLFHAQQPLHHYMHPVGPAVYATSSLIESVRQGQQENSRLVLDKALGICHDKGVHTCELLVMEGDAKEMICQAAEQRHAHLLIVGSRGLGTLRRAFLGSVSDYCAHHARCPVLIVKPPHNPNH